MRAPSVRTVSESRSAAKIDGGTHLDGTVPRRREVGRDAHGLVQIAASMR